MATQNKQRPGCFFSYGEPKVMLLSGDGVAASSISLYYIEQLQTFPTVDYRCGVDYVEYGGQEVTHNVLVWSYGFSDTASTVVDYDNDEPWSWYNSEMNLYWDVESNSWNASIPYNTGDVLVFDTELNKVIAGAKMQNVVELVNIGG